MADYKNGKIYRLVCNTTGNQYIGSTTRPLSQRLGGHKTQYKCFLAGKITKQVTSSSNLSNNNCEMILIEDYPCENKNQLERRERHFIETMECVNKNKPAQTKEEHFEYMKQYEYNNKEKMNEYQHTYRQENKYKITEYQIQYRQKNKEEIKQYHQENQEKLTQSINCECGGHYQYQNKSAHFKSKRHKKWATPETI